MSQLEDLLQQCTVKLTLPGRMGWGTGFFVAPGWVLTCAHVVQEAKGEPVQVWWQKKELEAVVARSLPNPYDLALLQVDCPSDVNPPCVYLDEEIRSRDPLYLFGYPDEGDRQGEPRTFNCDGITGSEIASILFNLGQVRPGMSGSPLLNQRTGKVCGMVKFTRDRSIDLGGGAIPTRVILEQFPELRSLQQVFHGGDRRWENLITTQPGIDFQPYLRSLIANEKYQQKWGFYTPTDAVGKIQQPKAASELDIGLMVQLMQPKTAESDGTPKQEEKMERLPVLEGIRKYAADHVLLMGRPGSGKSTALLSLLVEAAQQALADPSATIPVLVELRYLEADRPSVLERIGAFLQSHTLSVEEATLKTALAEGKLLLLIDGVNELPSDPARRAVARFRQDYAKTPMIFTTRDMAIGGDVGIEKKLEMQPLNESQMRQFVQAYLPQQGEPMLRQLQGRLREVGQTPLLLWMLCQVFQGLHQIPASLGLLFRWFAGEYDKLKRDVPVSEGLRHWQADLLQQLAFAMMQAAEPTELRVAIPRSEAETMLAAFLQGKVDYPAQRAKEWLEDLLEHHLIQPTGQNQLEFHHQLLQEYYAAEYLLKLLPTLTDDQLKQDYLNYLKWTEPVALMLALVESEAQAVWVVKLALDVDWRLGARRAGEVKPEFQVQTVKFVKDLEVPDWLKVQLLGETKSDRTIASLFKLLEDNDVQVHERAVEALGKIGSETAILGLLKLLEHSHSGLRMLAADALGEIGSEAAIPGLLKLLEDSVSRGSARIADALGKIGSETAIPGLLKLLEHSVSDVRWNVVEALGKIRSEAAIPGLLKLLEHSVSHVRWNAVKALGEIGSKAAIPSLLKLLKDPAYNMRRGAAMALGEIRSEAAIPGLLKLLEDSDSYGRARIADALGKIRSEAAIPGLLKLLKDVAYDVRMRAAEALGKIGLEAAIPGLLKRLRDPAYDVRKSAAVALGKIGSEMAIPDLLKRIEDSDYNVRWCAAKALGEIGSEAAIPGLLKLVENPDPNVRKRATEALGEIGSTEAVDGLLKLLEDSDHNVRESIAEALGTIGNAEAIEGLLKQLEDSDRNVRFKAAGALGKIGSAVAIKELLKQLEDADWFVRFEVAKELGEINSAAAVSALLKRLEDVDSSVSWGAAEALGTIAKKHPPALSPHLPHLLTLISTDSGKAAYDVILAIQTNCKYYNYEFFQAHLAAQKGDRQNSQSSDPNAITIQTLEGLTIMTDKPPIFN